MLSNRQYLGISIGFFPSEFAINIQYAFPFPCFRASLNADITFFDLFVLILLGEENKLCSSPRVHY
jgi:hypothetical protein